MTVETMLSGVFDKSYNLFKKQWVALVLGSLVGLLMMVFVITIPPMVFGIYYLSVQMALGKTIKISDVFKGFNYFFRSWWMTIIVLVGISIGLALLVIPGLFLMVVWQYAVTISIRDDKSAWTSLKESYNLGKKNFTFSAALWIVIALINAVGSALYVGGLLTMPLTVLMITVATQKLMKK